MEFLLYAGVELFQAYALANATVRAARIVDNVANGEAPRLGDVAGVALALTGADIDILPDHAINEAAHGVSNGTSELIEKAPEAVVQETAGAIVQKKADAYSARKGKNTFDVSPTVNVRFCDSDLKKKLGDPTRIPEESIRKCRSSEFLQVGDVIRAKKDLKWDCGTRINEGTFGELKERDESNKDDLWLVRWWDDTSAKKYAYSRHIKKCKPSEFFRVGDRVQAKHDMTTTQGVRISKGTFGKLKERRASDRKWLVDWVSVGNIHTKKKNIEKCTESEYIVVGDIVKATSRLKWKSGETVEKGTLGKLKQKMENGNWLVKWYDKKNKVGEKKATKKDFSKCKPSEYFAKDDIMALVHDLTFENGKIRVPKGTLCTYL
mmetsp:Transcript_9858/g.14427  ORF Transcript_9858/g.14427 Transcript_9858/m.14427 type:complete len:378 (-) Transcript_9858:295-1428(-)